MVSKRAPKKSPKKAPKKSPKRSLVRIGPLRSGTLRKHGYSVKDPVTKRHIALKSAIGEFGPLVVQRKLMAVANLQHNRQPEVSKRMKTDASWVRVTQFGGKLFRNPFRSRKYVPSAKDLQVINQKYEKAAQQAERELSQSRIKLEHQLRNEAPGLPNRDTCDTPSDCSPGYYCFRDRCVKRPSNTLPQVPIERKRIVPLRRLVGGRRKQRGGFTRPWY